MTQMMGYEDTKKIINKKKAEIIFEAYLIYLVITMLSLGASLLFGPGSNQQFIDDITSILPLFVVTFTFVIIIRFLIKNYTIQLILYFVAALAITQVIYDLTTHRHVLNVSITVFIVLAVMLSSFNIKLILLYAFMSLLSLLLGSLSIEPQELLIDNTYIYNIATAIIIQTFTFIRMVGLFNWYNNRLEMELEQSVQKNMELSALNEEYIASEEELMAQYDEITNLNNKSQFLLKQHNAIVEASEEGMLVYDITNDSYEMTDKIRDILGEDFPALTITEARPFLSEDDYNKMRRAYTNIIKKVTRKEVLSIKLFNERIEKYLDLTLIQYSPENQNKDYALINVRDVTTEKMQANKIYSLAYYDKLTGLYNRAGFLDVSEETFKSTDKPYQIILLDIDNFKYFNDTFGYTVGDALIQGVAKSLKSLLPEDALLGRTGSDDFCIITPEGMDLEPLLDDITANRHRFYYKETEFQIKYSIGIALSQPGYDINDIIKHAEIAMYQVKEKGKNGHAYYNNDYELQMHDRLLKINALEKSINRNEITLNYQPIINSTTREIIGFEALVRWYSTKHGQVPPSEFIPLAENTGFIIELGDHILKEACQFANRLEEINSDSHVSVNISSKQLLSGDFAQRFLTILKESGTDAKLIAIEITESAIIENYDLAFNVLNDLKNVGIRVYLDDFGTGYSSLNHLTQLPIDLIKIDKSFIDNIHFSKRDEIMVKNIINMAEDFKLDLVAEGVETNDQFLLLQSLGAQMLQGYHFDKPLTGDVALSRLKPHKDQ